MVAHARLNIEYTEDEKYHTLMTWLNYSSKKRCSEEKPTTALYLFSRSLVQKKKKKKEPSAIKQTFWPPILLEKSKLGNRMTFTENV